MTAAIVGVCPAHASVQLCETAPITASWPAERPQIVAIGGGGEGGGGLGGGATAQGHARCTPVHELQQPKDTVLNPSLTYRMPFPHFDGFIPEDPAATVALRPKAATMLSPHATVLTSVVRSVESQIFDELWHVASQLAPALPSTHSTAAPPEHTMLTGGGGLGEGGGGEGGGGSGGGSGL